jgi:hypothetical protein
MAAQPMAVHIKVRQMMDRGDPGGGGKAKSETHAPVAIDSLKETSKVRQGYGLTSAFSTQSPGNGPNQQVWLLLTLRLTVSVGAPQDGLQGALRLSARHAPIRW